MEKSILLPLFFFCLLLNNPWMISATNSVDFPDHNSLSSSNKKFTVIFDHPRKISSDQQYLVNFHDVPSGPNRCRDDIC